MDNISLAGLVLFVVIVFFFVCWRFSPDRQSVMKRRESEARKAMMNLCKDFDETCGDEDKKNTSQILAELFRIHKIYAVPMDDMCVFSTRDLCDILTFIKDHRHCTGDHLSSLAEMLSWEEIQKYEDNKARMITTRIIVKFGGADQLRAMKKHWKFLNKQYKQYKKSKQKAKNPFWLLLEQELRVVTNFINRFERPQ